MSPTERDVRLLHFQAELVDKLLGVRRSDKALKTALRRVSDLFEADRACIAVVTPGGEAVDPRYMIPRGASFADGLFATLANRRRPKLGDDTMVARIDRRGRLWGHMVLQREGRPFSLADRRAFLRVSSVLSRQVQRIDRRRLTEVRARIDRKIMEQLSPKDLAYQLLHGLRSLTRYDHSAAVLTFDGGCNVLRLAAEQIAWRKGKSRRVGTSLQLTNEVLTLLETGEVYGFERPCPDATSQTADAHDGGANDAAPSDAAAHSAEVSEPLGAWSCWSGRQGHLLAEGMNEARVGALDEAEQPARSLLVAPLVARDRLLGVLEIAACHVGSLGAYEVEQVRRFMPYVAVAVSNLQRAENLELGMLAAERKHVMADLARGVSHDVNNALGAILPMVQQMQADITANRVSEATLLGDLRQVESSVQVCRRIFGGMLSFARSSARSLGTGDLKQALSSAMAVLDESLRRQNVEVVLDLAPNLSTVSATRGDLEQLLLNLSGNARDAMPAGGRLTIRAHRQDSDLVVSVCDTGLGIAAADLDRVAEPFFTTKRQGNGLGLPICRSIVWGMGGSLAIESVRDEGTTVTLHLPCSREISS